MFKMCEFKAAFRTGAPFYRLFAKQLWPCWPKDRMHHIYLFICFVFPRLVSFETETSVHLLGLFVSEILHSSPDSLTRDL